MKNFPAYHLANMENASVYYETDTEKRVDFNVVLENDGIPVFDRLFFFLENADEDVLARFATRVRQFHPEVGVSDDSCPHIDAETVVDAFMEVAQKRGTEMWADEALFVQRNQISVSLAAGEAARAELLAIAILALWSVEEDINEKRYRERCEREQASLSRDRT